MKAVILAAGRGSRMLKLTDDRPKCFVELQGKPLIEWQLDSLRSAGITEIAIVSGYRSECFSSTGITTFRNSRWSESNMVTSLACAANWLASAPCVVSYSDIVYCSGIIKKLAASTSDIAITYDTLWLDQWSRRFDDPLSDAETFRMNPDGSIREIGKKPSSFADIEGQYMGLLKFTPRGWAQVEKFLASVDMDRIDMTTLLNGLIESGSVLSGIPIAGGWYEIDSERDLMVAEQGFKGVFS